MKRTAMLLVVLMLLLPAAQAQWIDDDDDDARELVAEQEVSHGRAGAAELHAIDLMEDKESVTFTVQHAPMPSPGILSDSTYYNLYFGVGGQDYRVGVYHYVTAAEAPGYEGYLSEQGSFFPVSELSVEPDDQGFSVTLAKSLLRTQFGAIPTAGDRLTDFQAFSNTQAVGSICIGTCMQVGTRAEDMAPNGGTVDYVFQIGVQQEGDIRLFSQAPIRWSNGQEATFVYEVIASNDGEDTQIVRFDTVDVPEGWIVSSLQPLAMEAGEEVAVPIAVNAPFAHAHGSTPTFVLEASNPTGTGRIELGIHYPAIPQPTGHHSVVNIHTRTAPTNLIEDTIYTAVGAPEGEVAYMNTAEDDAGDEDIRVPGQKSNLRFIDESTEPIEVAHLWTIPLSPGLRVGLLAGDQATEGTVHLEFDIPVGTLVMEGSLVVMDRDAIDFGFNPNDPEGIVVATIESEPGQAVAGSMSIPVTITPEEVKVPFAIEQELVLFLEAWVARPDMILTPNTGVYLTGGQLELPLAEFHDSLPVNLRFSPQEQQELLDEVRQAETDEGKQTPGFAVTSMLAAIGLAGLLRRRI